MLKRLAITRKGSFTGHKDAIFALGLSNEAGKFYSGGGDGYIVEWAPEADADGQLLVKVQRPVYSFLLMNQGQQLLAGTADGHLHVIDMQAREEVRNITDHQHGLFDIKEMGDWVLTCGGDGQINVWGKRDMALHYRISASSKSGRVIAVHPDEKEFAVGFSDHTIRIYDSREFYMKMQLDAHSNSVFALAYSPDGNVLVSGGRDVYLKAWDVMGNYAMLHDIAAHNLHINALAYNPSGTLLASVSMDKTCKIWDTSDFTLLKVIDRVKFEGHASSVNKVLWQDDFHLLTCSDDKHVMRWEIEEV